MNVLEKQKEIVELNNAKKEIVDNIKDSIANMFNNLDDYTMDFSSQDLNTLFGFTNMFLNCSEIRSLPDFFNEATIIGSEEQIETLRRGQS